MMTPSIGRPLRSVLLHRASQAFSTTSICEISRVWFVDWSIEMDGLEESVLSRAIVLSLNVPYENSLRKFFIKILTPTHAALSYGGEGS